MDDSRSQHRVDRGANVTGSACPPPWHAFPRPPYPSSPATHAYAALAACPEAKLQHVNLSDQSDDKVQARDNTVLLLFGSSCFLMLFLQMLVPLKLHSLLDKTTVL
eukprot:439436-Amphidinium_carterae.1